MGAAEPAPAAAVSIAKAESMAVFHKGMERQFVYDIQRNLR